MIKEYFSRDEKFVSVATIHVEDVGENEQSFLSDVRLCNSDVSSHLQDK